MPERRHPCVELGEEVRLIAQQPIKSLKHDVHWSSRQLGKRLGVSHTTIANKLREHGVGKTEN